MDNHPKIGADGRVKNFHLLCPEDQDYILRLEKKVRDQRQIIKQLEKPVENNSKK